jgi:hypothetical protein
VNKDRGHNRNLYNFHWPRAHGNRGVLMEVSFWQPWQSLGQSYQELFKPHHWTGAASHYCSHVHLLCAISCAKQFSLK